MNSIQKFFEKFISDTKRRSPTLAKKLSDHTLVTQPMSQHGPNWMDLRSMDFYIQIFHYQGATVEERFAPIFGIYKKFGYKNPLILTPFDLVIVAT